MTRLILTAAVLAAGRSTRFGADNKLRAQVRGAPLASHVAEALRRTTVDHRLAVVADPKVAALFHGFEIIWLEDPAAAQSASLRCAVERAAALGSDRLLVALGDMPLVPQEAYQQVMERATDVVASAMSAGQRRTPPACFPKTQFARLCAMQGDKGARSLLAELPDEALVTMPNTASTDIDRKSDIDRLEPQKEE